MGKTQKVWIVWNVNQYPEIYGIFGTAQKAYEALRDYIEKWYDADDGVEQMLEELTEDYTNYPSNFGIEDVGGVTEHYIL